MLDDEIDPAGDAPVDYLAMHDSDGDTWDMLRDIERSIAEEEARNGDTELLEILDAEARAREKGTLDDFAKAHNELGVLDAKSK